MCEEGEQVFKMCEIHDIPAQNANCRTLTIFNYNVEVLYIHYGSKRLKYVIEEHESVIEVIVLISEQQPYGHSGLYSMQVGNLSLGLVRM